MRSLLQNKDITTILSYRASNLQSHCRNFIINTFFLLYIYTHKFLLCRINILLYILQLFSLSYEWLLLCILNILTEEYRDFLRWFYVGFTPNILPDSSQIMFFHLMLGTYNQTVINKCKKILYSLCHPAGKSLPISRDGVLIPQVDCTPC